MASEAMFKGEQHPKVGEWLRQSHRLNPADLKGAVLNVMYLINPPLCRFLIKSKSWSRRKTNQTALDSLAQAR
jgi:hypothetical protein